MKLKPIAQLDHSDFIGLCRKSRRCGDMPKLMAMHLICDCMESLFQSQGIPPGSVLGRFWTSITTARAHGVDTRSQERAYDALERQERADILRRHGEGELAHLLLMDVAQFDLLYQKGREEIRAFEDRMRQEGLL